MQFDQHALPDATGHFGPYGGVFVAETLMAALDELKHEYEPPATIPIFWLNFITNCVITSAVPARSITPSAGRKSSAARRFT
jgi:hypothetical protein